MCCTRNDSDKREIFPKTSRNHFSGTFVDKQLAGVRTQWFSEVGGFFGGDVKPRVVLWHVIGQRNIFDSCFKL